MGVALIQALPVAVVPSTLSSESQDTTAMSTSIGERLKQAPRGGHAPEHMHNAPVAAPTYASHLGLQRFLRREVRHLPLPGGARDDSWLSETNADGHEETRTHTLEKHEADAYARLLRVEGRDGSVVYLDPVPLADEGDVLLARRNLLHGCHERGCVLILPGRVAADARHLCIMFKLSKISIM